MTYEFFIFLFIFILIQKERDVIRCDRTHQYYKGENAGDGCSGGDGSLNKLRDLLLTYMMYDFDTGYVQGMSDLASPLLYVANGDVSKAFWFFTKVMDFTVSKCFINIKVIINLTLC